MSEDLVKKPVFKLPPVTVSELVSVERSEVPWGVSMVNAQQAWSTTMAKGIVVAIIDTGVATKHPDLQGRIIGGRNFTTDYNSDPNNFEDNNSHGTHVAGTIGAIINKMGVVGVAPEVSLLIGKVLTGEGSGDYDSIVNGIRWAVDWRGPNGERARVISMSLGGPQDYQPLHDVIKYAVANNVMVVVAAGNEGDGRTMTNEFSYPGYYDEVVEVGAIDSRKRLASFSNTNDELDVVAPGVDILSTVPQGWAKMSGTSMATPHVSAVVAMLVALYETPEHTLTEPEIYQLLLANAQKLGTDVKGFGHGLAYIQPKTNTTPVPTPTPVKYAVQAVSQNGVFSVNVSGFASQDEAVAMADKLNKQLNATV